MKFDDTVEERKKREPFFTEKNLAESQEILKIEWIKIFGKSLLLKIVYN